MEKGKKIKISLITLSLFSLASAGAAIGITTYSYYDRAKPVLQENLYGSDYPIRIETNYGVNSSNTYYLKGVFNGVDQWANGVKLQMLVDSAYYGVVVTFAASGEWKIYDSTPDAPYGGWWGYGATFSEGGGLVTVGSNDNFRTTAAGTYLIACNGEKIKMVKLS